MEREFWTKTTVYVKTQRHLSCKYFLGGLLVQYMCLKKKDAKFFLELEFLEANYRDEKLMTISVVVINLFSFSSTLFSPKVS